MFNIIWYTSETIWTLSFGLFCFVLRFLQIWLVVVVIVVVVLNSYETIQLLFMLLEIRLKVSISSTGIQIWVLIAILFLCFLTAGSGITGEFSWLILWAFFSFLFFSFSCYDISIVVLAAGTRNVLCSFRFTRISQHSLECNPNSSFCCMISCTCLTFKPIGGSESCLVLAVQLLPKAPRRTSPKDWLPFLHTALSLLVPETPTSSPELTLTSSREWDCCVFPGLNFSPRGSEKSPQAGILSEHGSTIMYFPSFKDYIPALKFPSFIVVSRRRRMSCTHHSILGGVRNSSWINSGDQWLMNMSLFNFIYMFWNIFNIVYSSCNVTVWIKWSTKFI